MKGMKDEWGEKFFNGICPYTDKPCDDWVCKECIVEEEERHLYDDEESEVEDASCLREIGGK